MISLVVAVSRNGVIGRDGGLPWRLQSDLKHFKATTIGKPVIMGRKTWDGLPRKPLPGRRNLVITRQEDFKAEGAEVAHTLGEALKLADNDPQPEICVIGGGEIFREALPLAGRLHLTLVECEVDGDTFFPVINESEWTEAARIHSEAGPQDSAAFTYRQLDRKAT
jgi:dihydrofolate reductase